MLTDPRPRVRSYCIVIIRRTGCGLCIFDNRMISKPKKKPITAAMAALTRSC